MAIEIGFHRIGFTPAYEVELDPEYPGDGNWHRPTFGVDPHGRLCEFPESRWGPPLVLRVTTEGGGWVGSFAAGGLGSSAGAYACPATTDLLVVSGNSAYLIDVLDPAGGATLLHSQVTGVVRADHRLLVVGIVDMVAVGPHGLEWRTDRLCLDGLRVIHPGPEAIHCTGEFLGEVRDLVVDPKSGRLTDGPAFID